MANVGSSGNTTDSLPTAAPVKRPRGRPRKILSAVQTPLLTSNSVIATSTQSSAESLPVDQAGSPTEQTTTHDASMDSQLQMHSVAKCESCSAEGVRIYKIGKLSVCKTCEALVRVASGSSRRRSSMSVFAPAPVSSSTNHSTSEYILQTALDSSTSQGKLD